MLTQGTSRCARHFFPLPLLLASSARRQTRERSLEDPRNGGLREKSRSGGTALRHGHGPGLPLKGINYVLQNPGHRGNGPTQRRRGSSSPQNKQPVGTLAH